VRSARTSRAAAKKKRPLRCLVTKRPLRPGKPGGGDHPAMIASRQRSPNWQMKRQPSLAGHGDIIKHASSRLTAGFEYIGPAMNKRQAQLLLNT
jgi:hypothetical protein